MATIVRNADGTFTVTPTGNDAAVFLRMKTEVEAQTGQTVSAVFVLDRIINGKLNEVRARFRQVDTTARQVAYERAAPAAQATSDGAIGFTPGAA
jgi:hypothetical protein